MTAPDKSDATRFVLANSIVTRTELLPEIPLHLTDEPFDIFRAADEIGARPPYWAFAWSGGQGLARWLLDNPGEVAGKRVLDIGAGSGLTTIAAMKAGAMSATAADTDPIACAAIALNAGLNNVSIAATVEDLLGGSPVADLVVIGDLFYEPELVTRLTAFLQGLAQRGIPVLYADRATAKRPPVKLDLVAEYAAALTPYMEIGYVETARVWRMA